jgi:TetR/AcrR family transcriptional repressor of bet genes
VREVALRAGVTPGLIRRYFDNKERLVSAAYRHFIAELIETAAAGCGDGSALYPAGRPGPRQRDGTRG